MILFAHLLTLDYEWLGTKVRLLRKINDEAGRLPAGKALDQLIEAARIDARSEIIVSDAPFPEVLHRHSEDASVVLLGLNVPDESASPAFQESFENILSGLPTTLLVCSSGEADVLA